MKNFHCDSCQGLVFFENVSCVNCGRELAFIPSLGQITALDPAGETLWQCALPVDAQSENPPRFYRKCKNTLDGHNCNWALDADDPNPYCLSCRLTQTIPDLNQPGHHEAWSKIESAKRRLIFSLLEFQLPIKSKIDDEANGVAFQFLADPPASESGKPAAPVLTGHDEGTIVLNLAEADDSERERRRTQLHEPYRTLLGHLRHEIGHFYWDRLIRDSNRLDAYRALFGDERQDYAAALKNHYTNGAPADWQSQFVSTYASSHPWEDWAETWAHYLHITDSLETADACGLSLQPQRADEPRMIPIVVLANPAAQPFDQMMERWFPLTYLLNNLNRGLGLADAYPFVLPPPALEKLRFVHNTMGLVGGEAVGVLKTK